MIGYPFQTQLMCTITQQLKMYSQDLPYNLIIWRKKGIQ